MPGKGGHVPFSNGVDSSTFRKCGRASSAIAAAAATGERTDGARQPARARRLPSGRDQVLPDPARDQSGRCARNFRLPADQPTENQPCLPRGAGKPRPVTPNPTGPGRSGSGRFVVLRLERNARLGARDMLGQPHPRLRQRQPKHLVVIVFGQSRHRDAFFRATAVVQHGPHSTPRRNTNTDELQRATVAAAGCPQGRTGAIKAPLMRWGIPSRPIRGREYSPVSLASCTWHKHTLREHYVVGSN